MDQLPPWRLFLWVKFIELMVQIRPRAIRRLLWNPEPKMRHAIRWYYRMGRRVWFHEIWSFLWRDRFERVPLTLGRFWGAPLDYEEEAMAVLPRARSKITAPAKPLNSARMS